MTSWHCIGVPRPDAPAMIALASLLAALAVLAYLLAGAPAWAIGFTRLRLALDGVSGLALLTLFSGPQPNLSSSAWRAWLRGAGTVLAMLAGDAALLLLGAGLAAFGGSVSGRRIGAWVALLLAMVFLGGDAFAAMRAAPPGTARGFMALLLGLGAAWGMGGRLGLYLLMRVALDLAGTLPPWAGLFPMLGGGVAALMGARAAWRGQDVTRVAEGFGAAQLGLAMAGAGVALAAAADDLSAQAAQALAGMLLAVFAGGVAAPLLPRAAGPGAFAPLLALAWVPPGLGFAALWTVLRAIQGLPPPAGAVLGAPVQTLAVALLVLAAGFVVAAALLAARRVPAGAMPARDHAGLAVAGIVLLLGVWPEAGLRLGAPAARLLAGVPPALAPGYSPLAVTLLLGVLAALAVLFRSRLAGPAPRIVPAWNQGEAAPLPSLPPAPLAGGGWSDVIRLVRLQGSIRSLGEFRPHWDARGRLASLILGLTVLLLLAGWVVR